MSDASHPAPAEEEHGPDPGLGMASAPPGGPLEPPREASVPGSTVTRLVIPVGIAWAGLLLSAFVYTRLPEATREGLAPARVAATFLAVPLMSLAALMLLRAVRGRVGAEPRRSEDVVVAWVMTFFLGIHCLVLALALRLIGDLATALPIATGLLFIGLGPALGALEPGSAMGIRTRATLASPELWRSVHRALALLFPLAGVAGFAGAWLPPPLGVWVAVLPGVIALAGATTYAATRPVRDEDRP